MAFAWSDAPRPIIALAPMAGVTDGAYRRLIKRLAPEIVVFTELLSTDALAYGGAKTMRMMAFNPSEERPFIVQIFGKDPKHFLEASKIIEQAGADGIDINMGCPAAKVVSSCHGSALIRNPALAASLVAAAKKAVKIPVSVKTRLGWDTAETLIPFCRTLQDAGADAFAIHGRRYVDKFSGSADWAPIYELKRAVTVPVIGNGDIFSAEDAQTKIGNLDGVMVGRGTLGNPWLMADIVRSLRTGVTVSTITSLSFDKKIPLILEHCALAAEVNGEGRGMREMRKHLASYVRGIPGAAELRAKLVRVEKVEEVRDILGGRR